MISFEEKHAAAQSLANPWTKLASTYRCIHVTLTEERLSIRPIALIGWLTRILFLDLYHDIDPASVTAVEKKGEWFGYGKVVVSYQRGGESRSVLLYLKKYQELLDVLRPVSSR